MRGAGPVEYVSADEVLVSAGPGVERAVVWGEPDEAVAVRVIDALRRGRVASPMPQGPVAFALRRADGSVVATTTQTWRGGLFWSHDRAADGPGLVVGVHPGAVVAARRGPTSLDEAYLRGFLSGDSRNRRTPYRELSWVEPAMLATWSGPAATPQRLEWSGPSAWPAPTLEGPEAVRRYRACFDEVTAELMADDSPLVVLVSGGLDSTFVAATLATLTTPERPVHGFSHAPLAEAGLVARGNWDPDDSHVAATLADAYPGRLHITRMTNSAMVPALDAALAASRRSWMPTANPGNQVWIDAIAAEAAALGARRIFVGEGGNASFSGTHRYAALELLAQGRLDRMVALTAQWRDEDLSLRRRWSSRVIRPLGAAARGRLRPTVDRGITAGGVPMAPVRREWRGRRRHLQWMAGRLGNRRATQAPGATVLPLVDPFMADRLLATAASITPFGWSLGPDPRGFARQVGAGRVPDAIRLRRRRGGQAWDSWFVARHLCDRYLAEAELAASTPALAGWLHADVLQATVRAWPWGERAGPPQAELIAVDRVLTLAAFIRMTDERLRALPTARR